MMWSIVAFDSVKLVDNINQFFIFLCGQITVVLRKAGKTLTASLPYCNINSVLFFFSINLIVAEVVSLYGTFLARM